MLSAAFSGGILCGFNTCIEKPQPSHRVGGYFCIKKFGMDYFHYMFLIFLFIFLLFLSLHLFLLVMYDCALTVFVTPHFLIRAQKSCGGNTHTHTHSHLFSLSSLSCHLTLFLSCSLSVLSAISPSSPSEHTWVHFNLLLIEIVTEM